MSKRNLKDRLFGLFFPELFGVPDEEGTAAAKEPGEAPSGDAHLDASMPEIEYLQALRAELLHRKHLRGKQEDRQQECQSKYKALEQERLDLLTRADVEEDDAYSKEAQKLLTRMQQLDQERKDALGIANRLGDQQAELEEKITVAERGARICLGKYLEKCMAAVIERYKDLAPELVEAVLQMRAIQKLMQEYQTGNSNGFQGDIHIPTIVAFDHKNHPPMLLGGSREFADEVRKRLEEIKRMLQARGFRFGK